MERKDSYEAPEISIYNFTPTENIMQLSGGSDSGNDFEEL